MSHLAIRRKEGEMLGLKEQSSRVKLLFLSHLSGKVHLKELGVEKNEK